MEATDDACQLSLLRRFQTLAVADKVLWLTGMMERLSHLAALW